MFPLLLMAVHKYAHMLLVIHAHQPTYIQIQHTHLSTAVAGARPDSSLSKYLYHGFLITLNKKIAIENAQP